MKAIALALLTVFAAGSASAQSAGSQPKPVASVQAAGNGTSVNGAALSPGQSANLFVGDVVSVNRGQVMVSYAGACMVRVPNDTPFTVVPASTACVAAGSGVGAVPSNAPAQWPYIVGGVGAAAAIGAAASGGGSKSVTPRPSSP